MCAVVSIRGQYFDRFDIAAQLVGDDDPGFTKPGDQSLEKPLCSFGISACLYNNIKDLAIRVDRAPQPVLLAADRDHNLILLPRIVRSRAISTDALREMLTKAVYPQPDCFTAYNYAPFGQ